MLIKALIILLMFGAFIFAFSILSEKDTLEEVKISNEFRIKTFSGWKLRLVENKNYELTQNSEEKINKIEFFTLDSLNFPNTTTTKELAEKIIGKEILAYENSKLKFSNGFLEHLRNHKFYSLEEVKFQEKDWLIYSSHNSDKFTSVWVNVFTILESEIFVFHFIYNIEDLNEIVSKERIANLLKKFLVENDEVRNEI